MKTLEQKKFEVEMYLHEKDAMKRLSLEQLIAGKRQRADKISQIFVMVFALGIIIGLGATHRHDDIWIALFALYSFVIAWISLESAATTKQILALKEYFDRRLSEEKSDPNN